MDRRSFLKGLLGTTALAALPISLIPSAFASGGVIPVTVKFYGLDTNYPGVDYYKLGRWHVYQAFEKTMKLTPLNVYTVELDTREITQ